MIRSLSLIFICMATVVMGSGCVAAAKYRPENLAKPAATSELSVNKEIRIDDMNGVKALMPGKYLSEFEDTEGIFFRGPELAYWSGPRVKDFPYCKSKGGLWVSKDSTPVKYRMYFYKGSCVRPPDPPGSKNSTGMSDMSSQMIASSHYPIQAGIGAAIGMSIAEPIMQKMWADEVGKIILLKDLPGEVEIDITR